MWTVINRERGESKRLNEEIKIKESEDYFKSLLRGVEWRVVKRNRKRGKEEEKEMELTKEEVKKVIVKVKDKKAVEVDRKYRRKYGSMVGKK